jgi:hypothetical protein
VRLVHDKQRAEAFLELYERWQWRNVAVHAKHAFRDDKTPSKAPGLLKHFLQGRGIPVWVNMHGRPREPAAID